MNCLVLLLIAGCAAGPVGPERSGDGALAPAGRRAHPVQLQSFTATPITDAPADNYQGMPLGLYGGSNVPPSSHDAAGLASGLAVQPIDGEIVLVAIGMSNFSQEVIEWTRQYRPSYLNGNVRIVRCATGGATIDYWDSPVDTQYNDCDRTLAQRPQKALPSDVQVVIAKLFGLSYSIEQTAAACGDVVAALRIRYPNVKQIFLFSRMYGGYGTGPKSEPFSYEQAFGMRECILNNTTPTFVGWGAYLWASGATPRLDGLAWIDPDDYEADKIHPSLLGEQKVAAMINTFLDTSPYTEWWPE